MTHRWQLGILGVVVVAGLATGYWLRPDAPPSKLSRPAPVVAPKKPEAKPTVTERIVYQSVPVIHRVVETRVDTLVIQEFVEAAQNPDSLPAQHLPYSFEFDGEEVLMWGVMSDGSTTFARYDARPKFRAGWEADSTFLREERLARFPKWRVGAGVAIVAGVVLCLAACR